VIGASRRRGSIGGELFRNILAADFAGAAYPVNRDGEPVAGVRAYRSIEEIPDPVDLALICVPAARVLEAASSALRKGVCVISSGFAELGGESRERQERLLALVRAHGARLVGPNCLGIALPGNGLNATFAPGPLPAGRSPSPPSRARSGLPCSRRGPSPTSASPPSSRSATRPTPPPTTSSSGGKTTTRRTSSSCTCSRSATRASSAGSPAASPSSPSRPA
jgi:predicted CoA-binding protein